ncbi:MAG: cation-translocating P-type ATPase [Deltaproteobacteria bacterium]|jgi:Ca2+-transporting ATPase|nr:cation-translocating P-type ATPase [Deltaproteobacteria bacterium]
MTENQTPGGEARPEIYGLTPAEVEESRRAHGANVLTPPPRDPWWKLYLEKFEDPIIRILLVAAVVAILAGVIEGQYAEGIGIVIAVFLATTLGFINEYKAGQEFDILNKVSDDEAVKVVREGVYARVPKKDLVVGDVCVLEQGEEIPADGEVLTSVSFQVNEASLTGESLPVTKRPQADCPADSTALAYPRWQVLRGTFVSDGHALVSVSSVGDSSEIGKTARSAAEETETVTPLNRQLGRLGQLIGVFAFAVAFIIFTVLSIRSGVQGDLGHEEPVLKMSRGEFDRYGPALIDDMAETARAVVRAGDTEGRLAAAELPVGTREHDGEVSVFLKVPVTGGQIFILIAAFVSLMVALVRIIVPVIFDAVELAGRPRPENAWIDREGLVPWLQAVVAGAVLFGILAGIGIGAGLVPSSPSQWIPVATGLSLLRYFMVAVTIIVVAVPEGLPMSVTLSLAYSMRKMTAANNLVRRMHACETIGAANVICSDKTGTLTMNRMKVTGLSFESLPKDAERREGTEWALAAEAVAANSTANLGADAGGKLTVPLGNPTESALLIWLSENGRDYRDERARFKVLGQLTFSTERKYMATVGEGVLKGFRTLHVKGAPEIVLSRCRSVRLPDGTVDALSDAARAQLQEDLKSEQSRGMRTLGLAMRQVATDPDTPAFPAEYSADEIASLSEDGELTFLGFFSIADPVRPEVPPAVEACAGAGVAVKMVTGDNQATAREIALEIGIIRKGEDDGTGDFAPAAAVAGAGTAASGSGASLAKGADSAAASGAVAEAGARPPRLIVPGDEFMAMDEEAAFEAAKTLRIMSRAKPLAKQRLVNLLQKGGAVVAVTGDGSNDAPALNHADVGLAMGITGTSVAKEAADIILLDDSFASIVKAIMWGRSIYLNIQKFILFQLTINVVAVSVALLGPFLGIQLPLTVTQMLWVNLIMDTFAALALASEPPDWELMKRPPRNPEDFIVTPPMARFIFCLGGFFLALFLVLVLCMKSVFPMNLETELGRHNLSVFFTVFVFLQFWNLFNARMLGSSRSALSNLKASKMFMLVAGVICLGQILMTQFGGEVFRTVPLTLKEWIFIIVLTSPVLWVGELVRLVKRRSLASRSSVPDGLT